MERPEPLVPRDLRFGVPERVAADGAVLLPLDEAGGARVAAARLRREKIEAVAVCFLHSFTNEAHERRAGAILAEELPGVADLALLRGLRPRSASTSAPRPPSPTPMSCRVMAGYLGQLEAGLREGGHRRRRCC